MIERRDDGGRPRRMAAAMVIVLVAVTGCSTEPPPAPSGSVGSAPIPAIASATPSASASRTAAPTPLPGTGRLELDVMTIDPVYTTPLLEVASTGTAIIYSSGAADGPDWEYAPDLYRLVPGADEPELLWSNPVRERDVIKMAGDADVIAFTDYEPVADVGGWRLLVIDGREEAIELDAHPRLPNVPSAVPSLDVDAGRVVWSAFDLGEDGPISQLLIAEGPDWSPRELMRRDFSSGELWLPSLFGDHLAYTEIFKHDDGTTEYGVLLTDLSDPGAEPRRLDTSGHASTPIVLPEEVIFIDPGEGMSMFNWGQLMSYSLATGEINPISMSPQPGVRLPSAGSRFVGGWGMNVSALSIFDLETRRSRRVERYPNVGPDAADRAHIVGDLMVWIHFIVDETGQDDTPIEVRYAWLPVPGSDRPGANPP